MSDASPQYVALYSDALMGLTRWRESDAKDVLFVLCKHADKYGWCDPGDALISALSGHRRDAVPDVLARLQAAGYIHIVETPVPHRQKPLRGFQVNPGVLRLRPEHQAKAFDDWNRFISQTIPRNNFPTMMITYGENDQQPDQNQNQLQNQLQNQNQEPAPNQRKTTLEEGDQRPAAPFADSPEQKPGQDAAQKQGEAPDTRSAPTSKASASAPSARREPKNLLPYRKPLEHLEDENLALDLVNLAGDLSRENARMLVDTYGWERAARVAQLYRMHTGSIQHPGRWMRSMLRKFDSDLWKSQGDNWNERANV